MASKRASANPPGRDSGFQKLRSLSCFNEVYERICAGWPLAKIARFIQEERQEYPTITPQALAKQLAEFRKTMPPGDLVQKRFPDVFEKAKAAVEEGIDEVAELEELYRIQKRRIDVDFRTEKAISKLLPSMTAEMREARQMLETLANMKMDLGLLRRVPKGTSVNVAVEATLTEDVMVRLGDGAARKVLQDPESRHRVMGVVERFLKLPAASEPSDDASN